MKHAYLLLLAAVMLLTFSACRSTKGLDRTKGHVSGTTVSGTSSTAHADANAAAMALVKEITAQPLAPSCLTAKVKVDLEGMGKSISVNGQLRMKRDDVVQLSLTFLGMEVGRMEFTPQDVLIIDRMNKQYVRAAYSEVGFLQRANLDFYALQALFWNELFIPGERNVGAHASRFRLSEASGRRALTLTGTPRLNYTFYAAPSSARLEELDVKGSQSTDKGKFSFSYSDFAPFGGRQFPTGMKMAVGGAGKDLSLQLRLSRLASESGWQQRTTVSSKYTRRSVDEVLGKLLK